MTPDGPATAGLVLIQANGQPATPIAFGGGPPPGGAGAPGGAPPGGGGAPPGAPGTPAAGASGGPGGAGGPTFAIPILAPGQVLRLDGSTLAITGAVGEQAVTLDDQTVVGRASPATSADFVVGSEVYAMGFGGQSGAVTPFLALLLTGPMRFPPSQGFAGPAPGNATPAAPAAAAATAAPVPAEALQFRVVSGESQASYTARETLIGQGIVNPIGTTKDVSGTLTVLRNGTLVGPPSAIRVDLRTLKTDVGQRDQAIRGQWLESNRYPFADFTLTKVEGVPATYNDGDSARLTLTGNLTLHGVTRPTTWTADVRLSGRRLTGTAQTDLKLPDYGIRPPDILGFVKVEDNSRLEIQLVADQQ
jgi:polyisoprenoid-binding protein YceI